jgi:hypothetical protein
MPRSRKRTGTDDGPKKRKRSKSRNTWFTKTKRKSKRSKSPKGKRGKKRSTKSTKTKKSNSRCRDKKGHYTKCGAAPSMRVRSSRSSDFEPSWAVPTRKRSTQASDFDFTPVGPALSAPTIDGIPMAPSAPSYTGSRGGYYHGVKPPKYGITGAGYVPAVPMAPEYTGGATPGYKAGKYAACSTFDEAGCKRRPRCTWDYTKNKCGTLKGAGRAAALKLGSHKAAWAGPDFKSVCGGRLDRFSCNTTSGCQWRDKDNLCVSNVYPAELPPL